MRDRLWPLGLILLLAALLAPVFQDFVRDTIVEPLLYLLWIGRLLLDSVPQVALWGLFLVAALLIAGGNLLWPLPLLRRGYRSKSVQPERIERWARLIRRADQETYYKWQLAQHLRKLTLEALAHDERLTPKQIQQRLADPHLNIPPEIQAYLQASLISFSYFLEARPRSRAKRSPSPLDLDPERVVRFLEDRFQVEA